MLGCSCLLAGLLSPHPSWCVRYLFEWLVTRGGDERATVARLCELSSSLVAFVRGRLCAHFRRRRLGNWWDVSRGALPPSSLHFSFVCVFISAFGGWLACCYLPVSGVFVAGKFKLDEQRINDPCRPCLRWWCGNSLLPSSHNLKLSAPSQSLTKSFGEFTVIFYATHVVSSVTPSTTSWAMFVSTTVMIFLSLARQIYWLQYYAQKIGLNELQVDLWLIFKTCTRVRGSLSCE